MRLPPRASRACLLVASLLVSCDDLFLPGGSTNAPFCTGVGVDVCASVSPPSCSRVDGCIEFGACSGTAAFCLEYAYDVACRAAGCTWDETFQTCAGEPIPCEAYTSQAACTATGRCSFVSSGACAGVASCAGASLDQCRAIPGCDLACASGLVLCNGTCVTTDIAQGTSCASAFEREAEL